MQASFPCHQHHHFTTFSQCKTVWVPLYSIACVCSLLIGKCAIHNLKLIFASISTEHLKCLDIALLSKECFAKCLFELTNRYPRPISFPTLQNSPLWREMAVQTEHKLLNMFIFPLQTVFRMFKYFLGADGNFEFLQPPKLNRKSEKVIILMNPTNQKVLNMSQLAVYMIMNGAFTSILKVLLV